MAQAVKKIRGSIPEPEISDAELAELVASHALAMGFSVLLFDAKLRPADSMENAEPAACTRRSNERSTGEADTCIPKLRRAAAVITHDQEEADELVESALRLAIATIDDRPANRSLDDWLHELLSKVVVQGRRRSH